MFESLLITPPRSNIIVPSGNPLAGYNWDANASTGSQLITPSVAGTLIAPPVPTAGALQGYSKILKCGGGAPNVELLPRSFANVGLGDYTVEFRILLGASSGYVDLFTIYSNPYYIYARIGDAGFGNRVQVSMYPATIAGCWNIPYSRTDMTNAWRHMVLQRRSNKFSCWFDGVKQSLANGTGSTYNTPDADVSGMTIPNASFVGFDGTASNVVYVAEVAFFNIAKYTGNFTPPVGYMYPIPS